MYAAINECLFFIWCTIKWDLSHLLQWLPVILVYKGSGTQSLLCLKLSCLWMSFFIKGLISNFQDLAAYQGASLPPSQTMWKLPCQVLCLAVLAFFVNSWPWHSIITGYIHMWFTVLNDQSLLIYVWQSMTFISASCVLVVIGHKMFTQWLTMVCSFPNHSLIQLNYMFMFICVISITSTR